MHISGVSSLTTMQVPQLRGKLPKSNIGTRLKQGFRKAVLPLICSTALMHGVAVNAQNRNTADPKQDTVEFVKNTSDTSTVKPNITEIQQNKDTTQVIQKNIVQNKKTKKVNHPNRFYPSFSGEYDYMFGVGNPVSAALGQNSMIVDDKTGSFVNFFTGVGFDSPNKDGQKVSAIGILVSEVYIPKTPLSVRGRVIGMTGASNVAVVDIPTPRVTIPISKDKKTTIMAQPMVRFSFPKGSKSYAMYGGMINSSFPLPVYIEKHTNKSKAPQAYLEVLGLYNPQDKTFYITGFLAIPFPLPYGTE